MQVHERQFPPQPQTHVSTSHMPPPLSAKVSPSPTCPLPPPSPFHQPKPPSPSLSLQSPSPINHLPYAQYLGCHATSNMPHPPSYICPSQYYHTSCLHRPYAIPTPPAGHPMLRLIPPATCSAINKSYATSPISHSIPPQPAICPFLPHQPNFHSPISQMPSLYNYAIPI